MNTILITGSWGELTVHRDTGHIISYDDYGKAGWDPDDRGYHDILFFDPAFLRQPEADRFSTLDILEAAYVDNTGRYEVGMPWTDHAWQSKDGTWLPGHIELAGLLTDQRVPPC